MTTLASRIHPCAFLALLIGTGLLCACGGGSGTGDPSGGGQLAGPFIIDFESPAADTTPEVEPFSVGPNVTMQSLSNLILWSNAQGWVVREADGCPVTFLGNQGIGSDDATDDHTMFVNFISPVATVEMRVAAAEGTTITIQSLDAFGGVIETIPIAAPSCPGPMSLVRLGLFPTSNAISRVRINGNVPVIDDLTWYQFQ